MNDGSINKTHNALFPDLNRIESIIVPGGGWGFRSPVSFRYFRFQGGRICQFCQPSNKNSTHCFALAILPSLLKPAIHAVAHVFIGFEPTFIHYQWIYIWICCMRHVNFTDSWLWSEMRELNPRTLVPKTSAKPTQLISEFKTRFLLCSLRPNLESDSQYKWFAVACLQKRPFKPNLTTVSEL